MEEVKDCVRDLRNLIVEAELDERKAFLRSFVQHTKVDKEQVKIVYRPPWQKTSVKIARKLEFCLLIPLVGHSEQFPNYYLRRKD